jgi:intracellular septation protein A
MADAPAPAAPPSPRAALFWSLAPLAVFYLVEDAFGLTAALLASMAFTAGDLAFTWWRHRTLDRIALVTGGLVLGLGSLSLLAEDERFMLYAPVIGDALFAGLLAGSVWRGRPLMVVLAERQDPTLVTDAPRRAFLRGMTLRLAANLALHGVATGFAAEASRETWLFVSGPLQYLQLGVQFGLEILWGRISLPPEDDPPG